MYSHFAQGREDSGRPLGRLRPNAVRLKDHPILEFPAGREVEFTFDGKEIKGIEGEPIAAALHAAGVRSSVTVRNSGVRGGSFVPSAPAHPV